MPKRVSSKVANYIKPGQLRTQSSERSQIDESTIEDIAKILMQKQTTASNKSQANESQEVLNLLHQINSKLESLQGSVLADSPPNNQPQQNTQDTETANSAAESNVSQELKKLFSTLLTTDEQTNTAPASNQQQTVNMQQQQDQNSGQTSSPNNTPIVAQTAAQVLAQAQYELSNELEASLKSLKQVINESEKIAAKISNLLGEETNQKQ